MALKMDTSLGQLVVKDAYVRVEQITHNRFEGDLVCLARCYQNDPGFPPAEPAFRDITFSTPFDSAAGDPYAQAYAGAKALEQFQGAIDC